MAVEIEPSELNFQRPFTVEVSRTLTIKNPNTTPVAFKVKTTAPRQYCVRPNSGRIEPGHDVELAVLLQAMKNEPPPEMKCRDKFLVQSAPITGDKEFASIQSVLETTDKKILQERKIRVNWLPAEDNGVAGAAVTPVKQAHVNGSGDAEGTPDVSRVYGSPSDDATHAPPPYTSDEKSDQDFKEEPVEEPPKSKITQAKEKAQMTLEEAMAELEKARAEIASLQQQGQLRLRKAAGNSEKPVTQQLATAVKEGTEGVPVKVVAILCFFTFLLSYIFF